ncbi:MAG: hypothetical protein L3J23_03975 [Flavobacteriaceae bacterium]|nr:hypothetical protein [Flavobacteriaceae bacterium]
MVIKTENLVGQIKNIDIGNFGKTFTYNGEVLENNTLNNFNISKDLHKIKLKIKAQQEKPTTIKK